MSRSNLKIQAVNCGWSFKVFLIILLLQFYPLGSPPNSFLVYAADANREFEAEDDLTVSGTEGTKNDADLEVKGVSAFSKDIFIEAGLLASPYGGLGRYENLLLYSEEFNQSAWTTTGVTVTANNTTYLAPDGQASADLLAYLSASDVINASSTSAASTQFTASLWLRTTTGTATVTLSTDSDGTATSADSDTTCSLTTSWKRFSVTKTFGTGTGNARFKLNIGQRPIS